MTPIPVRTRTRLHVTYCLHPADKPVSQFWVVLHHGICHTREQFRKLIAALNASGLNVVMIDQQSEHAIDRNWITIQQYRDGMADALRQLRAVHPEILIGCYALHSMGALVGMTMQRRYWDLRRPTVLMTPIPAFLGALPITLRLLFTRFGEYYRAVVNRDIVSLAQTREQVNHLFFDGRATDESLNEVVGKLNHAPFLSYIQLALLATVTPWRRDNHLPKLLLTSAGDHIFRSREYWVTRRWYSQLTEKTINGGHDFFIPHADWTASQVGDFLEQHESLAFALEAESARFAYPRPHFKHEPDRVMENAPEDRRRERR